MILDQSPDHVQLSCIETIITSQVEWIYPNFAGLFLALDMNVRWFVAIETCEEEPVRSGNSSNARHWRRADLAVRLTGAG
jgi:hypothetical protein